MQFISLKSLLHLEILSMFSFAIQGPCASRPRRRPGSLPFTHSSLHVKMVLVSMALPLPTMKRCGNYRSVQQCRLCNPCTWQNSVIPSLEHFILTSLTAPVRSIGVVQKLANDLIQKLWGVCSPLIRTHYMQPSVSACCLSCH